MTPKARARNVALCYVRKSFTKNGDDSISPERQREHIQAVVDAHGWTAEWYEDTQGHKSGLYEANRPAWLKVKARLKDPEVVALVANDLSRLHRKGYRIGDLLEMTDRHGVKLVVADPRRQFDFSTPQGRIFAQMSGLFDEYYATDVSERQKSHAAHRKAQGKTCGVPPFGTKRDKNGYLMPTDAGAWRLPDGSLVAGKVGDAPPVDGAVWRGFYECARRILELFAEGTYGLERIARTLTKEGWAFRDRQGDPRPADREDVRRVIGNYPEYGGVVLGTKSKERRFYDWSVIELNPERAVFDVALLKRVEGVKLRRTYQRSNDRRTDRRAYALQNLIVCAHCQQAAIRADNPKLASRLGCQTATKTLRYYRHKAGLHCGCKARSIPTNELESAFLQLARVLTVSPSDMEHFKRTAVQLLGIQDDSVMQARKQSSMERAQLKLDAARQLYADGEWSRDEYLKQRDRCLQDLAYWQAYTTETEQIVARLTLSVETLNNLVTRWPVADDEERNGLARSLFDYVVYDLDERRIIDFRLKDWAEGLLTTRAIDFDGTKYYPEDDNCIAVPHRGIEPLFQP